MLGLGPTEVIIILIIALVIFGPSNLPKIGKSVGEAIRNFRNVRDSTRNVQKDLQKEVEDAVLGPSDKDD